MVATAANLCLLPHDAATQLYTPSRATLPTSQMEKSIPSPLASYGQKAPVQSIPSLPAAAAARALPPSLDYDHSRLHRVNTINDHAHMDRAHAQSSPQNHGLRQPIDGLTPCNVLPLPSPPAASQPTTPNPYPDTSSPSTTPYRDALLRSIDVPASGELPPATTRSASASLNQVAIFPMSKASLKLRCFRCLSKLHKVADCRDPVRCARCGSFGHRSADCNPSSVPLALALPPFTAQPASQPLPSPMASPSAPTPFADDGSVIVAAPNGDLWLGARRFNLTFRPPYNIHNQPGQRANPINFYSEGEDIDDDDSAPPSQQGSATRNDPMPDIANDAANGILQGTPIASRARAATSHAARLGGPVPEIFVPQHFLHDVSNLAFAVIDGNVRQELTFVRAALELNPRCPPFVLAPSAFGAALLIFPSNADRDRAIRLGPYTLDGATVSVVTPDAAEDISTTSYDVIVELRASKYPLRLWHPAGANFVFGSIGKLCCVDQCSVTGQDFTVIRAFVLLERGKMVPPSALLRMPNDDVVIIHFDVDNAWLLDMAADAPPPPPPVPRPQTVPTAASVGTQTEPGPESPRAPPNSPHVSPSRDDGRLTMNHPSAPASPRAASPARDTDATQLAIEAADAAQLAADELISHAEELISSIQQMHDDPPIVFNASASEQGHDNYSPRPPIQTISLTENIADNAIDTTCTDNFLHTPDPFHVREEHRRRTRVRRATEAAAKVRRSQRLAAKQEAKFVGMLERAVKKKAASFDLSAASPSLNAALLDAGLIDDPDIPSTSVQALRAVARECGATDDELASLSNMPVPEAAP
ncbi:hypothetical protein QYE76_064515 [Lolium multiflorum]|uniref:CCHC-type domain-containing protein n=1 Tax=Lolium multiflorum TaxID=4521 RepID=A0AAD8S932_LOLMU|nr:hypothetical protein QYE76_064515 [Lolium multiflorum]